MQPTNCHADADVLNTLCSNRKVSRGAHLLLHSGNLEQEFWRQHYFSADFLYQLLLYLLAEPFHVPPNVTLSCLDGSKLLLDLLLSPHHLLPCLLVLLLLYGISHNDLHFKPPVHKTTIWHHYNTNGQAFGDASTVNPRHVLRRRAALPFFLHHVRRSAVNYIPVTMVGAPAACSP